MFIYKIFSKLKRKDYPFKQLVNLMYDDPLTTILNMSEVDYVVTDNCKFWVTDQIVSIQRVKGNPWFDNMLPDDICVDIGANIGAITIPLAEHCKSVYAIEPIFYKGLSDNVHLNKLENVVVMPFGIGKDKEIKTYEFSSGKRSAVGISFKSVKDFVGRQIDFLKIDCEGCEWQIQPEELEGIRELRIEFHFRRGHKKEDINSYNKWAKWLDDNNYEIRIDEMKMTPCVPFFDYFLLNASKKEAE